MHKTQERTNNRIITLLLVCALVFTAAFICVCEPSSAASGGVRIGQATSGEGGRTRGGKAGDQGGGEVSISNWSYGRSSGSPYHWKYVFRAKDPSIGKALAEDMKAAAANNHVGYDQSTPDRYSFYERAKEAGWDISAITTNCETTCASAVSVCLNAEGINVPKMWYSGIVAEDLKKTGQFYCFTSSDYTASPAKLLPGDILVNPDTHTAMVVESPNSFQFEVSYKDSETKEDKQVSIDEGTEIQLNLNNGEVPEKITIEDKVDLADYAPEKGSFKFSGWTQTGEDSFAAEYEGAAALKTTNTKKKISD